MTNNTGDLKKIAHNTAFLYIRMLLIMAVQFFTVRITLKYLGVEDYGIYNVVCGVTNMFTFITHTMTSASQRFLSYDLGVGDLFKLKKTFNTLVYLFFLSGIIGVWVLSISGYWFINNYLIIPDDRLSAAIFAFYISVLSLFISIIALPYNSLIIAHEDMKAFAYISVIDAIVKLLIVYCLTIFPIDKLKLYSSLMLLTYLFPSFLYILFCFKRYREVSFTFEIDKSLTRKILPFMSWNLLGGISWTLCTQGLSIVINMFFGPIANAAKAVADKVNTSINGFTNNFMIAVQPQIVKTYAQDDLISMHKVFYFASKTSFFLMMLLTLPIAANADGILSIWLQDHDALTTRMLQVVLLFSLISALEVPINQSIRATGNIKNYQIYIGIITCMVLPLAYFFFYFGFAPWYGYISMIIVYGLSYIARLYFLRKQVGITIHNYFNYVLKKCMVCFLISLVGIFSLKNIDIFLVKPIFVSCTLSFATIAITVYYFGINKEERLKINRIITKYFYKDKK